MLYYRIGEYQYRNRQYKQAARSFSRVSEDSRLYPSAKYQQGLSYAKVNQTKAATRALSNLEDVRSADGVTDPSRVAAIAGQARVAYQAGNWDLAIEQYRKVPRDTEIWHSTLLNPAGRC